MSELAARAAQVAQRAADLGLLLDCRRCGEIAAAATPVLQAVHALPAGDAAPVAPTLPYAHWLRQCAAAR
ncbi:hypothetical protein OR16_38569 [Cupriavidus basilensis OR16]|uniref:Uncharacterized protein n=1 Tax=Cupriavidus basilensis OR16 TaxID=1127483 RepID=H1SH20_9BURK|nr:hypothetical protein [Cupriavidus basilensis]EHP38211.1 hypothetical protein OR16_38569 [Cupriavidus basilensis OR16]